MNKRDELLNWIEEQGGVTMFDMVQFCKVRFGHRNKSFDLISQLIIDHEIDGDLWEGLILWKVKDK